MYIFPFNNMIPYITPSVLIGYGLYFFFTNSFYNAILYIKTKFLEVWNRKSTSAIETQIVTPKCIPYVSITVLTQNYVQKQMDRFTLSYNVDKTLTNFNSNIDDIFYSNEKWSELLKDPQNYLEKKWKTKILFETTPRGNIVMFYDAYKLGFSYYSDQNMPYTLLNAVACKYVLTFFCRDFFMDEVVLTDDHPSEISVKHKEESETKKNAAKQNTAPKIHTNNFKSNTKSLFANFKSYNNVSSKANIITNTIQSDKNKRISEKAGLAEPKQTNRFIYLGKIVNLNFLQKYERPISETVIPKIEGELSHSGIYSIFSPSADRNCVAAQTTAVIPIQKNAMSYTDYKRLLVNK